MIPTTVDRTDHQTGQEIPIPPDVLTTVERANGILKTQLESYQHLPLQASWCLFRNDPKTGWVVSLHVFTTAFSYGRQVAVEELRSADRTKDFIREVLWEFGEAGMIDAGVQLQKIRSELKELLAR